MEVKETKSLSGYGKPPWIFKGRALYQLHLVKAKTARAFIPKEFRLVEAFGYTLGGFFLASYDDSPAGIFDELVVIAGIVWNPPTSCAWAARVLVNSVEACIHGRKDVGLPSQVARFSKSITAIPRQPESRINGFLNMIGISTTSCNQKKCMDIQVTEIKGLGATDIYNISLTSAGMAVSEQKTRKWMGPAMKMSLPSFSGRTEYNPHLLKYSCQIECRVRATRLAKVSVSGTSTRENNKETYSECQCSDFRDWRSAEPRENEKKLIISVMLSKPICTLELNCLKMKVEAPTVFHPCSRNS
ncbi:unnamed protein product [Ilex paraguariensis]|uniref:Protein NEOXANTHIN-DEFICIENT 1 n=1 Tax=Ilex paraguariensis TaxID=185542 RepID=A0ABC8RHX7_9AQUA